MRTKTTENFKYGVLNNYEAKTVPRGSASDAINWGSRGDKIELARGRSLIGAEENTTGSVQGHHWAFRKDGIAVQFRKIKTKVQYYNSATDLWIDVITGLTTTAEYTFSNYGSITGFWVYVTGVDGIYKISVANPGSFTALYNSSKNYKGKSIISNGAMWLWDIPNDPTTLVRSYIDKQTLTTVTAEVLATGNGVLKTFTGTLAFKGAGATRTGFAVQISEIGGIAEVFNDNRVGGLTGSLGGTGTINYTTGEYSVTFNTAPAASANNIKATYQWEDSNNGGISDFTYSGTRIAGQGLIFYQYEGGDPIQMLQEYEGSFFSLKQRVAYKVTIGTDDLNAENLPYRRGIGLQYWRSSVATILGVVFMNTANPDEPQLTRLEKNLTGDSIEPKVLALNFKFSNYYWDHSVFETWGKYIVFSGRTKTSAANNRLFLYDAEKDSVDIYDYRANTLVKNAGYLYVGDSITDNVYQVFTGWDDDGTVINNYWDSKQDDLDMDNELKKVKSMEFEGEIARNQSFKVYGNFDDGGFELLGTITGTGTYVDKTVSHTVGSDEVGSTEVGGGGSDLQVYHYFLDMKVSTGKFRKRIIRFQATGYGYASVSSMKDKDILLFTGGTKMPKKYRTGLGTS